MRNVVIIDSDTNQNWTLGRILQAHGYRVHAFLSAADALAALKQLLPDFFLVDLGAQDVDGLRFCRYLRASRAYAQLPLLAITALDDIESKILAFNAGVDDYLIKPFDPRELLLRMQAVSRRQDVPPAGFQPAPSTELSVGDLRLSLETATVFSGDDEHLLTPTELDLLRHFMENPNQVIPAKRLMATLWGHETGLEDTSVVRWHIKNLRLKIETDPGNPCRLRTLGRHGYILYATQSAPVPAD